MHAVALRYLDQVARLGSIRRASEVLNVASSAVNRQILKLESELGIVLFDRTGNGVRPTPAGEIVVRHARETLASWGRVKADISSLAGSIAGEVRLISIPSFLIRVVPRAIEQVARRHPRVAYRVIEADPTDHVEEMRAGRPDLAILFTDKRYRDYELVTRLKAAVGAIVAPDHPLASRDGVTLTQCAAYPVTMLSDPWLLDAASEVEFVRSGARFEPRLSSNSFNLMKEMMKSGLAIGFFTQVGFLQEIARGELKHVPLTEDQLASNEMGLFVHRSRSSGPAIEALTKALIVELSALEREIDTIGASVNRPRKSGTRRRKPRELNPASPRSK
jgi:DNA-binding transcriptional LysR family regulator